MPSKVEQIVTDYAAARPNHEQFAASLANLLGTLLTAENLDYVSVRSRAKDVESFRGKITREGKNYADPLAEITDLCGARVVCYDLATLRRIVEVIQKNFEVDPDNSVDKAKTLEPDQFGYLSVHFVVKLNEQRRQLPEYRSFAAIKAEIQVRTALQHAWAVLDHGLRYKARSDVPKELQRSLYRISALLELADGEFLRLMEQSEQVRDDYAADVSAGRLDSMEVDSDSVDAFVKRRESTLGSLGQAAQSAGFALCPNPPNQKTPWTNLVRTLHAAGIRNLKSFDEALARVASNAHQSMASLAERWQAETASPRLVLDPSTLLRLVVIFSLPHKDAVATMNAVKFGPSLQAVLENELMAKTPLASPRPPTR
ncbi:MAG TPA: RelA/SpoT domain-containing protein [Polyangiaceae bacterium]|nr:RelA/SpoT domain-containing protein [Polyangiaceae bacterium]